MTEEDSLPVPRQRRFWPGPKSVRAQLREMARWAALVPNRVDRRAAQKGRLKAKRVT